MFRNSVTLHCSVSATPLAHVCIHQPVVTAASEAGQCARMQVNRTRKEIAQLIGTVFIHKSNVNLLSSVLDTPEYFWSAPDRSDSLSHSVLTPETGLLMYWRMHCNSGRLLYTVLS